MKTGLHRFLASLFRVRFAVMIALAWIALYYLVPWLVPIPGGLSKPPRPGIELTDRAGRPLRKLLVGGQRVDQPLGFADLPPSLVNAVISAEDQRFWRHGGIDFVGIIRAALDSAQAGRPVSGASTITQQLVKISRGRYENRSWRDKAFEVLAARRIEMRWDKKRIITEYLQRVEFGNQSTGCASAARGYFRKPLQDLSLAECAFLAGLPQAPSRLNPYRNFDAAKRRQEWVLDRMRDDRHISTEQRTAAAAEPLVLQRWTGGFEAPHFVDMLLQSPAWGGLEETGRPLRSSLDLELQHFCEQGVK
jgi:penicillin-binding protein 1C